MNCFHFFFCFFPFLISFQAVQAQNNGVYIVYMGAATSSTGAPRNDHDQILNSLKERRKDRLVYSYDNSFSGFAAILSEEEAQSIALRPEVVSVFPDPIFHLHTTRSWDFLKYQNDIEINLSGTSGSNTSPPGADTIIGILDTGIWPESKSFSDKDMGPIPSRWKGTCMEGPDFKSSNCNRKLIGARYYSDNGSLTSKLSSPRDQSGHGTHVAATAAGSEIQGASYHGLAQGIAKGGSPGSRIAIYRVCTPFGCQGSAILKAFDDAIADGVDILSLSLGSVAGMEFSSDPIAIGAFHAVEKGIIVVCSAGNDGPERETVLNVAPWILTVAATTIDRFFESDVVLGGSKVIKGGGIHFSNIQKSPVYPLIYGLSAKDSGEPSQERARNCLPDSLDKKKVKGKILLCESYDDEYSASDRLGTVISLGGIGIILIDDDKKPVASVTGSSPMTTITYKDGDKILSYINSTRNPVATILPTLTVSKYKPAPSVAYFSARGPIYKNKHLIKPDIAAPGVDILAAWPPNYTKEPKTPFNILSGTSMACPHVSGIAATVKSQYPSWSPSAIRSAIMTTAIQTNNLKAPITTNNGDPATPYDFGAGEVSLSSPLQPGLVYETETTEYLQFLCNKGYNISKIKLILSNLPAHFSCPSNSNEDLISNMNYPSIAISHFNDYKIKKVKRTVTNVGGDEPLYTASEEMPTGAGLEVQVTPNKLQFTKNSKKLSYEVTFMHSTPSFINGDVFGSITWTNGKYKVRIPFVVT